MTVYIFEGKCMMSSIVLDKSICFYDEKEAFPGVIKVAEMVKNDFELVFDNRPGSYVKGKENKKVVIYGTIGHSRVIELLEQKGFIDLKPVRGKWEVYSFQVIENISDEVESAIVIAGSDKRGTIYGLFHLSELIGVSPLVNWNHVWPRQTDIIILSEKDNMISREPSVKYRGFFINDEWPAFGNWATKHFGGINAKCYERVYELLLRLKGNYLWPAMWNSNFELDGPGLESAYLADELGVVISMSHHEPCMRSGGEYSLVRGKDSIYGDAWDYNRNEQGITRFWRDGLIRTNKCEQVITMGMRGENDTAIMQNATLEDNINLLRRAVKKQNELIRETINDDLSKVPRQIVLFTEVEEFFYGNETTKGLMDDPELQGVTLILSDNNVGYTRTLPNEKMREHEGGYGMYYHMDMHGGPYSFQWIGSTYLPRVWDQMTTAYEYGVRDIWVTNIGDIGTQEFGVSFFLDLAYDIDKYGVHGTVSTNEYRINWVRKQFNSCLSADDLVLAEGIIDEYTTLLAKRKHEVLNDKIFHPVHFGETQEIIDKSDWILESCERLREKCPDNMQGAFISLLYYPACGTANLFKLWMVSGRNKLYANQNRVEANDYADEIKRLLERDEKLIQEYMSVDGGYFDGFGMSEHIGFTYWNDEDCKLPQQTYVIPAKGSRMIVVRCDDINYLTGDYWRDMKPQIWDNAMRPDVDFIEFEIANAGTDDIHYLISTECPWISFSSVEGVVFKSVKIKMYIDRTQFDGEAEGMVIIENKDKAKAKIIVKAYKPTSNDIQNAFWEKDGYVSIDAEHYTSIHSVSDGGFEVLSPYGRCKSAIRVYPVTADFYGKDDYPYTEYNVVSKEGGEYIIAFYMSPSTPVTFESYQYFGYSINEELMTVVNSVDNENIPFFLSPQWEKEAINNIKIVECKGCLRRGLNTIRFYGISPQILLEKIVLSRKNIQIPQSYLGPNESYFHR